MTTENVAAAPEATPSSVAQAAIAAVVDDGNAASGLEQSPAKADSFADEDAELADLQTRIANGETGDEGNASVATSGTPNGDGQGGQEGAAPAAAAAAPAKVQDPKDAALIALRRKTQEQATQLAVQQGELAALRPLAAAKVNGDGGNAQAGAQAEPEVTVEQAYDAIANRRTEIAGLVDQGKMTMVEYAQEQNRLDAESRELMRYEQEEIARTATESTTQNDLGLQEHSQKLMTNFPCLVNLTAEQLKPYEAIAYAKAKAAGKPITADAVGTKRLRESIAVLAERDYDPASYQKRVTAWQQRGAGKPAAAGEAAKPGQPVVTNGARPTAAQREAKLSLAANHPVDIGNTGAGANGAEPSSAEIEKILMGPEDAAIDWMTKNPGLMAKHGVKTR